MNLKDAYNTIARDWVADHSDDTWWQTGTNLFLDLLASQSKVLDVGCGAGVKTKYISTKGYQVEGVDFSEKMIEIAKERNPDVEFSVFDIYDIDTFPKKFDGIFAQAVLLHIEKKRVVEVLKKFKNILNENGLLYVAVKEIRENQPEEEVKDENDYGYVYQRFFSYYTMPELEKYFTEAGYEIVKTFVETAGKTNWLQIVGRKNRE